MPPILHSAANVEGDRPLGSRPVAWKCENCRQWIADSIAATVLLVDDIAREYVVAGAVRVRSRAMRKLVVCPACSRKIGGS